MHQTHARQLHVAAVASSNSWTAASMPDQGGRTALVTGANSGLGFHTSLELARQGAHVIMTARDPQRGRDAEAKIRALRPRGTVELRLLDLADLEAVNAFAETLLAEGAALDMLFNNAGVMMPPRTLTAQGHELQFGVNHLAHFALTCRLSPRLRRSRDARVVTVSSDLHKRGRIHFDDLTGVRRYGRIDFYAQSKFANALFGLELARRLSKANVPVRSVLAHPGYAATNLQLSGPRGVLKLFMRLGNRFLAQPVEMGVLPQLYAATADVASGEFVGPDGPNEKRGHPTIVQAVERAHDAALAARLWELSEQLTNTRLVL